MAFVLDVVLLQLRLLRRPGAGEALVERAMVDEDRSLDLGDIGGIGRAGRQPPAEADVVAVAEGEAIGRRTASCRAPRIVTVGAFAVGPGRVGCVPPGRLAADRRGRAR